MVSLYELSVVNYLRVLSASIATLKKSEMHFIESGQDLDEIVSLKLAPDMFPFSFQVHSIKHHSLGATQGLLKGEFGPPNSLPECDYAGLVALLEESKAALKEISEDEINALEGKPVIFKMGSMELPFTAENFVQSFSFSNLYFHAATAYDMLRMKGAPIGKVDFIGPMKIGLPE